MSSDFSVCMNCKHRGQSELNQDHSTLEQQVKKNAEDSSTMTEKEHKAWQGNKLFKLNPRNSRDVLNLIDSINATVKKSTDRIGILSELHATDQNDSLKGI
jgi:hypothetical protein